MNIELIVDFLQQKIGMNPESVGHDTMKKAIYSSMLAHDLDDFEYYYQLLNADSNVLQELIEAVIIPETSFFRDKQPFQALKENLRYFSRVFCKEGVPLKILSIPSSTGEEPYSIAMTCLEAGLSYDEFEIHACDISQRVLDVAVKGEYGEYSFRGCDPIYKQRYFTHEQGCYTIDENLKKTVRFFQGNLLGDGFVSDVGQRFHIVFCRNLLIYFDRQTKRKAIDVITLLLHDDGVLVVGHADTAVLPSLGYKSLSHGFSFTYVKCHSEHKPIVSDNNTLTLKGLKLIEELTAARSPKNEAPSFLAVPSHETVNAHGDDEQLKTKSELYQEIEKFFYEKEFLMARKLCETYIVEFSGEGEVYHILGRIALAEGEPETAEEHFKKAIYLHPDDENALYYLTEIMKQKGDKAAALRYQQRADRIKARKTSCQET